MLKLPGKGNDSDVVWICKGNVLGSAKELDMMLLLDGDWVVEVIHPKVRNVGDHTCR